MVSDPEVTTRVAHRLWGRGRLRQLAVRTLHQVTGHDWTPWQMDDPEDELGGPVDLEPATLVFCYRGCAGMCGVTQTAEVRYDQVGDLPT